MHLILFIAIAVIIIWALLILAGRLTAPFYLEGRMVRFLMANNGNVPLNDLKYRFREYHNFDDSIKRLTERNNIDIVNETVVLKMENIEIGFKNKFMMWGTRRVKI